MAQQQQQSKLGTMNPMKVGVKASSSMNSGKMKGDKGKSMPMKSMIKMKSMMKKAPSMEMVRKSISKTMGY